MIKPLIIFSNAFDCPPVLEELKNIPCDQLHVNYFEYPKNHRIGEEFFRQHKEYTHYIPLAPDLVVTRYDYEFLLNNVEKTYSNEVYGVVCNVDQDKNKDRLAICGTLPEIKYEKRVYQWSSEGFRQAALERGINVIDVKFNAFAFSFIPREIIEKVPFRKLPYDKDERPIWEKRGGFARDLAFCHYCDKLGIKLKVDLRVKCKHLRYYGELLVGKKPKSIKFFKYSDNQLKESDKIW